MRVARGRLLGWRCGTTGGVGTRPRGDAFSSCGGATYYFEVGEDGWPTRQVEVYDAGPVLRYGPDRVEDEYGQLGEARLDELMDWAPWEVSQDDFEKAWHATR